MDLSLFRILLFLVLGICLIVVLTARFKVHAFFALLLACFFVGLGCGLSLSDLLADLKSGFGAILSSIGPLIILGTTLGVILEHAGSTQVMAEGILRVTGRKNAGLAMSLSGFIVGLPIFCDSGFIVLSGLTKSLAKSTGISIVIIAVSLATGLYSVHCLIPPHPGASAAAGIFHLDYGKLIFWGILVALPAFASGYAWANYAGRKIQPLQDLSEESKVSNGPSFILSFAPVLLPILLIALKSLISVEQNRPSSTVVSFLVLLGDPVIALAAGLILALLSLRKEKRTGLSRLLQDGAEKAGGILVIIGAGGAFGSILAATHLGARLGSALPLASLGLFFPFLVSSVLKTAQGSSTVAVMTAASIVFPLLPALGLDTEKGHLLCVLAMGCGSMMISHANDAYFWVIAKFSGLETSTMLKVYSPASFFMGMSSFLTVLLLSYLL